MPSGLWASVKSSKQPNWGTQFECEMFGYMSWIASLPWQNTICLMIEVPPPFILLCLHHMLSLSFIIADTCVKLREVFKEASPPGSCSRKSTNALLKLLLWHLPLIERLSLSKHPLSPSSDVTGHFHTPTLFNTMLFILHWTLGGHNCIVLVVVWAIYMGIVCKQRFIWGWILRKKCLKIF